MNGGLMYLVAYGAHDVYLGENYERYKIPKSKVKVKTKRNIKKFIKSIVSFNKIKTNDDIKCTICYDDIKTSYVTTLCKHNFHYKCLTKLVLQSNNNTDIKCPCCRHVYKYDD
jgi:hypothetical protein